MENIEINIDEHGILIYTDGFKYLPLGKAKEVSR